MSINIATFLIIITVAVSYFAFSNSELLHKLLLWPYKMKRDAKEYYRMLTSGFVHKDMTHLLVNMLTFYFFADVLLTLLGNTTLFLFLYCSAIIVANIPSAVKYKDNYGRLSLGASGGVSAIVFAYIYLYPWELIYLFFIIPIPAILFAIAYVTYSYFMKDKDSSIGHEAHLWGALYGFIFMLVIDPTHGQAFIEGMKSIPYFK